ncbi:hypothetical protein M9458_044283 [Cirrhinus mrigala]|uniref:Uncharacterized protein n=1 Tax=Cirrhinus mrigala TaxID=683832 RepID=A0ABD0NFP4_CIRMR
MWKKLLKEKREEFEEWYRRFKRHENFLRREFVFMPGYQPDWREEIRDKTDTRVTLRGKKSILKWKNFKGLFQKKREWWDMLPPKVPPREYRVLYFDIPKKWPIRSLLLDEPDEPENDMIQSHTTEIHLVKPVMIDLHAVVCQAVETGEDQKSAAASEDEEYFSSEE